jgi:integrase/recombinase XerD
MQIQLFNQDKLNTLNISNLLNEYLAGQLTDTTRRSYRTDIISFFGEEPTLEQIKNLTPHRLNEWRNKVWGEKIYSVSTINRKLTALNTFYEYMKACGVVQLNPVNSKLVKRIKNKNANIPQLGLSITDLKKLLKACFIGNNQKKNIRDYSLIVFGYNCILRPGEISNANWQDVKKQGSRIVLHLPRSKGGANDFVPLEQPVLKILDEYFKKLTIDAWHWKRKKELLSSPIFVALDNSCYGQRISTKSINNIVKQRAKLAGLKGIHAHSLRHSGITHLLEKNVPLHKVQELARHSDPKTTMAYNDLLGRMKDSPTNFLSELLFS